MVLVEGYTASTTYDELLNTLLVSSGVDISTESPGRTDDGCCCKPLTVSVMMLVFGTALRPPLLLECSLLVADVKGKVTTPGYGHGVLGVTGGHGDGHVGQAGHVGQVQAGHFLIRRRAITTSTKTMIPITINTKVSDLIDRSRSDMLDSAACCAGTVIAVAIVCLSLTDEHAPFLVWQK